MKAMKKSLMMRGMVLMHYGITVLLFVSCWWLFYRHIAAGAVFGAVNISVYAFYAVSLLMLSRIYSAYRVGLLHVGDLFYGQVLSNLISLGLTYLLACALARRLINPLAGFGCAAVQALFSAGWTISANRLYFSLHKPKRTVVIYRDESDLRKLEEIRFFAERWSVERTVQWDEENVHDLPYKKETPGGRSFEAIQKLMRIMEDYEAVFVSGVSATLRNGIVKYCVEKNKACYFVPHTGDVIISGAEHIRSFSVPICRARRSRPAPEYLLLKRAMDIVLSLLAIIVLSPFMAIAALAIWSYDRGPVLYKQVRLTKDGRTFEILKLRSMIVDAEKGGARLAGEHDDRITPVGRIIRAIRFDELPQLFNILKGDMSIVGPRPERPEIAEQYRQELPAFDLRLQVKAGLTGYAQIYGRYNTEPQDKLKMDLMYINHASLAEDIKLIFATVRVLFLRESTSGVAEGQTTASVAEKTEKSA